MLYFHIILNIALTQRAELFRPYGHTCINHIHNNNREIHLQIYCTYKIYYIHTHWRTNWNLTQNTPSRRFHSTFHSVCVFSLLHIILIFIKSAMPVKMSWMIMLTQFVYRMCYSGRQRARIRTGNILYTIRCNFHSEISYLKMHVQLLRF